MHGGRTAYFVVGENKILEEPPAINGGGPQPPGPAKGSLIKFGRLLDDKRPELSAAEEKAMVGKLVALGWAMNEPGAGGQQAADTSDIPAGYTYLGQFIAHEITFDDPNDTLHAGVDPHSLRTPQVDFDSLYGRADGEHDYSHLYEEDGLHFRVGETSLVIPPKRTLPHDLPRGVDADDEDKNPKKAQIADPRNDENLTVAQTHLAFLKFHNKVIDTLKAAGHDEAGLFECARRLVVRHFQWIIVHDYLPKIVDNDVLRRVLAGDFRAFKPYAPEGPTMPLEFSAAAFRIGHSMVRGAYDWNKYHRANGPFKGPATLMELFTLTGFCKPSGKFNPLRDGFSTGMSRPSPQTPLLTLPSDWVIDWRRFYDFSQVGGVAPPAGGFNTASKLDTNLNIRLETVEGFPGARLPEMHVDGIADDRLQQMQKAITVRNLLRGFYLGLPTGERMAEAFGEQPLKPEELAEGPHKELLGDPAFRGKTPLWYYILKEAELLGVGPSGKPGNRLGPVGSRIVAETLVGLVRRSPYSILEEPGWRPKFGRPVQEGEAEKFEMPDLLKFAFDGNVNPLG